MGDFFETLLTLNGIFFGVAVVCWLFGNPVPMLIYVGSVFLVCAAGTHVLSHA